ncbi:MAG: phosphoribosylamine--glycine ligase [Actinomycetes bacterium]
MRVLVVGSGAREHALCLALSHDPAVDALACGPGNAGTRQLAEPLELDVADAKAPLAVADSWGADLVVIGPEAPLVAGAADACRDHGLACFGPSAAAANIEGSKAFAKDVMAAAGVPTAGHWVADDPSAVAKILDRLDPPYVVKHDGLAAGKGVVVTDDRAEAERHAANHCVVIEEYLDGPEVSLFAVTDGRSVLPLQPAHDFKRVGDGDTGPNTGGMGAYSPLDWVPSDLVETVQTSVLEPTIAEMSRRATPFSGLLYAGLALTAAGPKVVEFNARFGDPETQVVLARLRTPLAGLLYAAATDNVAAHPPLEWSEDAAVTVVIAAAGYPSAPRTGDVINGLGEAAAVPNVAVLHAGTRRTNGDVVSAGGRVLSITATGPDIKAARASAYEAVAKIALAGAHYRTDIAAAGMMEA